MVSHSCTGASSDAVGCSVFSQLQGANCSAMCKSESSFMPQNADVVWCKSVFYGLGMEKKADNTYELISTTTVPKDVL